MQALVREPVYVDHKMTDLTGLEVSRGAERLPVTDKPPDDSHKADSGILDQGQRNGCHL